MPRGKQINLEKVLACLDAVCPKCHHVIPPAEIRRLDFDRMKCPACGEAFVPSRTAKLAEH
jgi:ribosomal protein S27AE